MKCRSEFARLFETPKLPDTKSLSEKSNNKVASRALDGREMRPISVSLAPVGRVVKRCFFVADVNGLTLSEKVEAPHGPFEHLTAPSMFIQIH